MLLFAAYPASSLMVLSLNSLTSSAGDLFRSLEAKKFMIYTVLSYLFVELLTMSYGSFKGGRLLMRSTDGQGEYTLSVVNNLDSGSLAPIIARQS
jgi:hypothetical protein